MGLLKNGQRVYNIIDRYGQPFFERSDRLNEKFYSLPDEKQRKIINAGFWVFSQNSYKKSPMNEIADRAGISKSLLFHYFRNKRELYLFLWDRACKITMGYLNEYGCYEPSDLFEMMERGMRAKIHMIAKYRSMTAFVVKAFYEKDPEINSAIHESYRKYFKIKAEDALARVDPNDFVEGIDLKLMYREMYLASEGYLWEIFQWADDCGQSVKLDAAKLEKDFGEMLKLWKKIYLKKGEQK